jgi:uncharacterized protein YeeX (DUF496 family)
MNSYFIQFLSDSKGKTEIANSCNCIDILIEDIIKEILLLKVLNEFIVFEMGIDSVWDKTILDIFVIGVVSSGNLELVIIEHI